MSSDSHDTKALIARRCKLILPQLKTCCEHHGDGCNGDVLGLGKADFEITLIDVRKMCLVRHNSATCGYLTLSYVWGGVQQYRLLKSNFDFLCQEGSLEAIIRDIPQIARDAIHMVQGLRGTYLWIDSLCIVQDDADQKHHQIAHMAHIYSRSFLTIVAAEAWDANSCLPFVHYTNALRPEENPSTAAPIDDRSLEETLVRYQKLVQWTFLSLGDAPSSTQTRPNVPIVSTGNGF
ncbi:hypothetical protein SLS58_002028 [Diplodia intermedia]|uniref:Heterokaryon incompatibility domain-containing protein n=1 Tax=Diplodia intermedia TaxID=856260 RepID=A0ABR3U0H8_9PEZI